MTEIIEGNRLIAEFMGLEIEPGMEKEEDPYYNEPYKPGFIPRKILLSKFPFHSSWDWLMSVVEKIESTGLVKGVVIDGTRVQIWTKERTTSTIDEIGSTKKEAVWLAVVEFIKWYNQIDK